MSKSYLLVFVALTFAGTCSFAEPRESRESRESKEFQKREGETEQQYKERVDEFKRTGKSGAKVEAEEAQRLQKAAEEGGVKRTGKTAPVIKARAKEGAVPESAGKHEIPESLRTTGKTPSGRPIDEGEIVKKPVLTKEQREAIKETNRKLFDTYNESEKEITKESVMKVKANSAKSEAEKKVDAMIETLLKDVDESKKGDLEVAMRVLAKEAEMQALKRKEAFNVEELTEQLKRFGEMAKNVQSMLPNDLPGHEDLGKNFMRNMMALYRRNPKALDAQIAKIKEYLKSDDKEAVKDVIRGLALAAESYGNPFFKALNEGKNTADAHKEAMKEMATFLRSKGLTPEELAEFDKECFKGSDVHFMGLATL